MIADTFTFGFSFISFFLAFTALLIIPGRLIFNLFFDRREYSFFEILPISFTFSLTFLSALGVFLYLIKQGVTAMLFGTSILILVLIVLNIIKWWMEKSSKSGDAALPRGEGADRTLWSKNLILWALIILSAVLIIAGTVVFERKDL